MSKAKRTQARPTPPRAAVPVKQNLKAANQRRQALRTHYAAKYRAR